MTPDLIPIHQFVRQRYLSATVQKIVEGWRVEPERVMERLTEHFREMGIFVVDFRSERLIMKALVFQLRNSPEILRLVARAREEDLRRQRSRHMGG